MEEIKERTFDDGNWLWHYECEYIPPWNNPKNWYYRITFKTTEGGYMTGDEITCKYFNTENLLEIIYNRSKINFFVENFYDIYNIIKSMVKGTDGAKVYPIYESVRKTRKDKLYKINKI